MSLCCNPCFQDIQSSKLMSSFSSALVRPNCSAVDRNHDNTTSPSEQQPTPHSPNGTTLEDRTIISKAPPNVENVPHSHMRSFLRNSHPHNNSTLVHPQQQALYTAPCPPSSNSVSSSPSVTAPQPFSQPKHDPFSASVLVVDAFVSVLPSSVDVEPPDPLFEVANVHLIEVRS